MKKRVGVKRRWKTKEAESLTKGIKDIGVDFLKGLRWGFNPRKERK